MFDSQQITLEQTRSCGSRAGLAAYFSLMYSLSNPFQEFERAVLPRLLGGISSLPFPVQLSLPTSTPGLDSDSPPMKDSQFLFSHPTQSINSKSFGRRCHRRASAISLNISTPHNSITPSTLEHTNDLLTEALQDYKPPTPTKARTMSPRRRSPSSGCNRMPPLPESDGNGDGVRGNSVLPLTSSADGEETESTGFCEDDGTNSQGSGDVGEAIFSNLATVDLEDEEPVEECVSKKEDTVSVRKGWRFSSPTRCSVSSDITLVGEGVDPDGREKLLSLDQQDELNDSSRRLPCHSHSIETRQEQTGSKGVEIGSPKLCCELADKLLRDLQSADYYAESVVRDDTILRQLVILYRSCAENHTPIDIAQVRQLESQLLKPLEYSRPSSSTSVYCPSTTAFMLNIDPSVLHTNGPMPPSTPTGTYTPSTLGDSTSKVTPPSTPTRASASTPNTTAFSRLRHASYPKTNPSSDSDSESDSESDSMKTGLLFLDQSSGASSCSQTSLEEGEDLQEFEKEPIDNPDRKIVVLQDSAYTTPKRSPVKALDMSPTSPIRWTPSAKCSRMPSLLEIDEDDSTLESDLFTPKLMWTSRPLFPVLEEYTSKEPENVRDLFSQDSRADSDSDDDHDMRETPRDGRSSRLSFF